MSKYDKLWKYLQTTGKRNYFYRLLCRLANSRKSLAKLLLGSIRRAALRVGSGARLSVDNSGKSG
jgi:hypothetical protein